MGFQPSFTWSYDPFSIIFNLRVELKTTPYNHTPRAGIERYRNQEPWEENTLQEAEEQTLPPSTLQTTTSQNGQDKRPREESSSSAKGEKEFIHYQKKSRTDSKGTTTLGQKEPIIINLHDSQVSTGTEETVIIPPSSSSISQNLLEITQSAGLSEQKEPNFFTNFLEIKQNNESLKANVCAQFWK